MSSEHIPNYDTRELVKKYAERGTRHDDIARLIGVSDVTLRKYYRTELDTALIIATQIVADTLFSVATQDRNVTALIFWLKTQARWREVQAEEPTDAPVIRVTGGLPTN